jgi:hypothetical protein
MESLAILFKIGSKNTDVCFCPTRVPKFLHDLFMFLSCEERQPKENASFSMARLSKLLHVLFMCLSLQWTHQFWNFVSARLHFQNYCMDCLCSCLSKTYNKIPHDVSVRLDF